MEPSENKESNAESLAVNEVLTMRFPSIELDDFEPSWLPVDDSKPRDSEDQFKRRQHGKSAMKVSGIDSSEETKMNRVDMDGLEHGFLLGRQSLYLEEFVSNGKEESTNSSDEEDSGLPEIYSSRDDLDLTQGVEVERPVISHRINKVGRAGQNLGLGHLLGQLEDDTSLRPGPLKVQETYHVLRDDSPVQSDITWTPPSNLRRFKSLVYEAELCDITNLSSAKEWTWQSIGVVHHPVLRVYRTDHKLMVGRGAPIQRQRHDVTLALHFRAAGQVQGHGTLSHRLLGEWSSDIFITFVGWDNDSSMLQLTAL